MKTKILADFQICISAPLRNETFEESSGKSKGVFRAQASIYDEAF